MELIYKVFPGFLDYIWGSDGAVGGFAALPGTV